MSRNNGSKSWIQNRFLESIASDDVEGIKKILTIGHEDLLCVIGAGAKAAHKNGNKDILNILLDENSEYEILKTFHRPKPILPPAEIQA